MSEANEQLALSAGLTAKTNQLCIDLEYGVEDIYELVTPSKAEPAALLTGSRMSEVAQAKHASNSESA